MGLPIAAPSILTDMPEDAYRAHPYVANSDLTVIRTRSPAHLIARRTQPPKPATPAMLDGRALHCAILEPDLFMSRYCVLPADAPRDLRQHRNAKTVSDSTRFSIDWWDRWDAANAGRVTLDAADYDLKMRVAENVRRHPKLRGYFDASERVCEASLFATDPETGTGVKARQDMRVRIGDYRVILDPKSADDCRPEEFSRSAIKYGYFQQAAFYTDISEWADEPVDLFLFIAFEKEAPFALKVYEVLPDELEFGRELYRPALYTWAECLRNNTFPAYDDDIEPLIRPSWARA